ncbi:hypothetical protein HPB49_004174 [Dermacentor silvarum]|uniref:Uncharacterized protein n=1 Tax=Dermacentor silvarum TaxID=543639 RepID=A0ACB8CPI3_DERSI|nr:hypothetical protein HPB49_004174 [Dermacentor silvarum]
MPYYIEREELSPQEFEDDPCWSRAIRACNKIYPTLKQAPASDTSALSGSPAGPGKPAAPPQGKSALPPCFTPATGHGLQDCFPTARGPRSSTHQRSKAYAGLHTQVHTLRWSALHGDQALQGPLRPLRQLKQQHCQIHHPDNTTSESTPCVSTREFQKLKKSPPIPFKVQKPFENKLPTRPPSKPFGVVLATPRAKRPEHRETVVQPRTRPDVPGSSSASPSRATSPTRSPPAKRKSNTENELAPQPVAEQLALITTSLQTLERALHSLRTASWMTNMSTRFEAIEKRQCAQEASYSQLQTQVTNAAHEGNFLHQLEEKLEVARLQAKVRDALLLRPDLPMATELAARLDAELVDVTHLYGEYADPYDLAECKLAIVRSSGYDKPLLVESLWQSLLEREFHENARPDQLSQRLESLAREYAPSEKFFPLAFLVKFLELRGSQHGFEPGWILEPLLGAHVSISRLRDAYNDLYRGKDPAFAERSLHLLHAIARLIGLFLEGRNVEGVERRRLANRCVNDIPGYLIDLQSTAAGDETVISLIGTFKELQASLDICVAN